jgi:hypothetical protein
MSLFVHWSIHFDAIRWHVAALSGVEIIKQASRIGQCRHNHHDSSSSVAMLESKCFEGIKAEAHLVLLSPKRQNNRGSELPNQ